MATKQAATERQHAKMKQMISNSWYHDEIAEIEGIG
jgi:hypothetical protein